jgi:hypothetical protein
VGEPRDFVGFGGRQQGQAARGADVFEDFGERPLRDPNETRELARMIAGESFRQVRAWRLGRADELAAQVPSPIERRASGRAMNERLHFVGELPGHELFVVADRGHASRDRRTHADASTGVADEISARFDVATARRTARRGDRSLHARDRSA